MGLPHLPNAFLYIELSLLGNSSNKLKWNSSKPLSVYEYICLQLHTGLVF